MSCHDLALTVLKMPGLDAQEPKEAQSAVDCSRGACRGQGVQLLPSQLRDAKGIPFPQRQVFLHALIFTTFQSALWVGDYVGTSTAKLIFSSPSSKWQTRRSRLEVAGYSSQCATVFVIEVSLASVARKKRTSFTEQTQTFCLPKPQVGVQDPFFAPLYFFRTMPCL